MKQKISEAVPYDAAARQLSMEGREIKIEIERMQQLPPSALRSEWRRAFPGREMPARMSRDLLVRTIAWKTQEAEFGRSPTALTSKLERLSRQLRRSGSLDVEREAIVKPGTTLLREWQGKTHRVTALEEGFIFRDQRFASLSEIATSITGTRWSGPRFFGLKQRSKKPPAAAAIND